MSYFLTEDQRLIVNSVREFCQSPSVVKMVQEEKAAHQFAIRSWQAAADQGYIAAYLPEEYGGMGYDLTTYFLIVEELARNGYPCCGAMAGHVLGLLPIEHWGTEEQKKAFLPKLGSGEAIACGAVTDPSGLTNFSEWGLDEVETDKGWRISGTKVVTTNAANADYKIVFGRPSKGGKWFDHVYVIPKDTPGLETGDQEHKLVPDCSDWGTIVLKDVEVPRFNRIDCNGAGSDWLGPSFLFLALQAMVLGYTGFKIGFDYATQRTRDGIPLIHTQKVAHNLADMAIRNETGRCLIYTGTRLWDEGRRGECRRIASMAKAYVCESTNKSLHDAVIIHGGMGYTVPAIIGVLWTSSIQLELAEMPSDVHRDFVIESYGVKLDWKD
ncbi:MAG: acyl-CoA dehydrogenase family protein [Coriobacteriales bacterium]|jgi:alkylation response protein AidB-like acyl-CoA dehydrogenase|nr:acyl-CoA dehydrogenase family protein [Coriobacteriales bacterium]